jgi:hypothetical protein
MFEENAARDWPACHMRPFTCLVGSRAFLLFPSVNFESLNAPCKLAASGSVSTVRHQSPCDASDRRPENYCALIILRLGPNFDLACCTTRWQKQFGVRLLATSMQSSAVKTLTIHCRGQRWRYIDAQHCFSY